MKRKRRVIPVLPNLITTANIFAGFYSIVHSIQGDFTKAAWAIVIGGVLDNLDGRVARITNSSSEFGVQYDSLSDLCTFGFAPALLAYFWALQPYGRVGWLGAFLFVVCAALRLARFNVRGAREEKEFFRGMPSPGAAGIITATVLFHQEYWGAGVIAYMPVQIAFMLLVYFMALLMVSGLRFYTFKTFSLKGISNFRKLVLAALVLTLIMFSPELFLFLLGTTYLLSGIIRAVIVARKGEPWDLDDDDDDPAEDEDSNVTVLPS